MEKHLPIIFKALAEYRMRTQSRLNVWREKIDPQFPDIISNHERDAIAYYEKQLQIIDDAFRYLKTIS